MKDIPKKGDLRVWWIPQVPMPPFRVNVPDLESANLLLDALAQYDLFQLKHNVRPDYCNAGGLERFEDGEWSDWYCDDTGSDFDDVRRDPEALARAVSQYKQEKGNG